MCLSKWAIKPSSTNIPPDSHVAFLLPSPSHGLDLVTTVLRKPAYSLPHPLILLSSLSSIIKPLPDRCHLLLAVTPHRAPPDRHFCILPSFCHPLSPSRPCHHVLLIWSSPTRNRHFPAVIISHPHTPPPSCHHLSTLSLCCSSQNLSIMLLFLFFIPFLIQ